MFEKYKQRFAKLEEDHEAIRKIRVHFEENRTTYIVGAGTLGVGFLVGKNFQRPIVIDFKPVITNNNLPTFNNTNIGNQVENVIKFGGRVSKIVRDVETGKEWQKMRFLAEEAAEKHGVSYASARTRLADHLHGRDDNFFGRKYEFAGIRTDLPIAV